MEPISQSILPGAGAARLSTAWWPSSHPDSLSPGTLSTWSPTSRQPLLLNTSLELPASSTKWSLGTMAPHARLSHCLGLGAPWTLRTSGRLTRWKPRYSQLPLCSSPRLTSQGVAHPLAAPPRLPGRSAQAFIQPGSLALPHVTKETISRDSAPICLVARPTPVGLSVSIPDVLYDTRTGSHQMT